MKAENKIMFEITIDNKTQIKSVSNVSPIKYHNYVSPMFPLKVYKIYEPCAGNSELSPLPRMIILGTSNSAANKDIMS